MRMTTMVSTVAVVGMGCAVALMGMRADAAALSVEEVRAMAEAAAEARAADLSHQLVTLERRVDGLRTTNRDLADRLQELRVALDQRGTDPVAGEEVHVQPPSEAAAGDATARRDQLAELRTKVMHGGATADELQRFLDLAKSDGLIDGLVADLEQATEERPTDLAARMELADAYVTKLMTVPGGPEQGVWGMKAETQWQAVLEVDDEHWDARHNLAYSWSMWPEFLGKTGAAIEQYERLIDVQEQRVAEDRHADAYVELSRLYERRGDAENARAMLARGHERHPDARSIGEALRQTAGEEE